MNKNKTKIIIAILLTALIIPTAFADDEHPLKCRADINHDGKVNLSDFAILSVNFHKTCAEVDCNGADIDQSGYVDLADFRILERNFLKTC